MIEGVDIKWEERPVPSLVTVANSVKYLANSYRRTKPSIYVNYTPVQTRKFIYYFFIS